MTLKYAVIIPAAGLSSRHPPNKLLTDVEGTPAIVRTIDAFKSLPVDIFVVTGYQREILAPLLKQSFGKRISLLHNSDYQTGMASSLKVALSKLKPKNYDYIVFCNGDRPFIKTETVAALLEMVSKDLPLIAIPTCDGQIGHPTFFSTSLYDDLMTISGDTGGRGLFVKYADQVCRLPVDDIGVTMDLDSWLEQTVG